MAFVHVSSASTAFHREKPGLRIGRSLLFAALMGGCSARRSNPPSSGASAGTGGTNVPGGGGSSGALVVSQGSGGEGTIFIGGSGGSPASVPTNDAGMSGRIPPFSRTDCPGALGASDAAALAGTAHTDPAFRFLYPYDGTVWPRGLLPPVLQWEAPANASDAVRVHIHGQHFDYVACLRTTGPRQLELPKDVWDALGVSNDGAVDPISVELTGLAGAAAVGPIAQHWTFANATMKGAIYYNTYNSKLPAAQNTGAVLRLTPGAAQAEVFLSARNVGECTGCHTASANGARLAADTHGLGGISYVGSSFFALSPTTTPNPPPLGGTPPQLGFGAFTPDGTRFISNAAPAAGGPFAIGNLPGTWGTTPSQLVIPDTGEVVQNSGIVAGAMMPSFSSDAAHVVFTDHAIGSDGKGIAMMDFDAAANTFSKYRQLYSDTTNYPGWSFFLPDGSGVVFTLGSSTMYTSTGLVTPFLPTGDIYFLDLAQSSGGATALAALNGFLDDAQTKPYLPAGERDLHKNYYSTGVPVAAGGYFWVFFTTRRTYGNVKTGIPDVPEAKQLWAAALDIGGTGDISHPAFYLRGQEIESGNTRAFAALEPCRAEGASCTTGIDCCGRFCTDGKCGPPPKMTCSHVDEGCKTAADCCPGARILSCIAGFCAESTIR